MTDHKPDNDDLEPGWNGLAILLWPMEMLMKLRVWIHNRIHPDDPWEPIQ